MISSFVVCHWSACHTTISVHTYSYFLLSIHSVTWIQVQASNYWLIWFFTLFKHCRYINHATVVCRFAFTRRKRFTPTHQDCSPRLTPRCYHSNFNVTKTVIQYHIKRQNFTVTQKIPQQVVTRIIRFSVVMHYGWGFFKNIYVCWLCKKKCFLYISLVYPAFIRICRQKVKTKL